MGGSQWKMHAGPLAVFVAVDVAVRALARELWLWVAAVPSVRRRKH